MEPASGGRRASTSPASPWWRSLPGVLAMFAGVVAAIVVLSSVLHEPAARRGGRASEAAVATLPYVATVQSPDGATIVRGARDDPGSHIDLLADGTQVRVTPSVDTWQQVQLADGRTGYVQGARLRRLAEPTP